MGLGTKNRQKQTADLCKQHLRQRYPDKLGLVEEFIVEIEGPPKNSDVSRWGQFTVGQRPGVGRTEGPGRQNLYDLAFARGRSQTPSRLTRYKIG